MEPNWMNLFLKKELKIKSNLKLEELKLSIIDLKCNKEKTSIYNHGTNDKRVTSMSTFFFLFVFFKGII